MSADSASAGSALPAAASEASQQAVRQAIAKSQQPKDSSAAASGETGDKDDAANGDGEGDDEKTTVEAGLVDPTKDVTVFSSQTDFTVKHPLYSPWTLWFDSASKQVSPAKAPSSSA